MLQDRPVLGVGLGSYKEASPEYVIQPGEIRTDLILKTPKLAHNTYLQFATEEGSIGVLLFLL